MMFKKKSMCQILTIILIMSSKVDGGWSEWSHSECSKTCESGSMTRTRKCDNPIPVFNGTDCVGEAIETITCNTETCPVDGGWSEWSQLECSKTCGTGSMTRTRECDNPTPAFNSADCVGEATETVTCNTNTCPETTTLSMTSNPTTTISNRKSSKVDYLVIVIPIVVVVPIIVLILIVFFTRRIRNKCHKDDDYDNYTKNSSELGNSKIVQILGKEELEKGSDDASNV